MTRIYDSYVLFVTTVSRRFALVSKNSIMTLLSFSLKARDFAVPLNSGFLFRSFGVPFARSGNPSFGGMRKIPCLSAKCKQCPIILHQGPSRTLSIFYKRQCKSSPRHCLLFSLSKMYLKFCLGIVTVSYRPSLI